jgi:thiol-disulfide isomerase/thioredoxin
MFPVGPVCTRLGKLSLALAAFIASALLLPSSSTTSFCGPAAAGENGSTTRESMVVTATTRPVVLDEFTATWCYYCYSMGNALDRLHEEYSSQELIIIAHHIWDDPFDEGFSNWMASYYGVGGVPSVYVNGLTLERYTGHGVDEGEEGILQTYTSLENKIIAEQTRIAGQSPPFTLTLIGNFTPVNPSFRVDIATAVGYAHSVAVRAYILEDGIPVDASNGQTEVSCVVRAALATREIQLTHSGSTSLQFSYSQAISTYDPTKLYPVVVLQDTSTKEVIGGVSGLRKVVKLAAVQSSWSLYQ